MKALVTGAAGFIGSHLSAALLESGATVTGIDCFTDYYPRPLKEANLATLKGRPGFTFIEAALHELDLAAALAGTTHVFHLAAQAGVRKSWGRDFDVYTRNNVEATQRLLEALVGMPIQKYVYASSSSVYGRPCAAAHARRRVFAAALPLWRVEAGRRASGPPLLGQLWRARCVAAVFHRLWPATAPGYGISAVSDSRQGRNADHRVRRRRADARLHLCVGHRCREHGGGRPGPSGQRVQYWWWLAGHVEPRARADTEGDRKDGCHSSANPSRKATCATPTPIRRPPAAISTSIRGSLSRTASTSNIGGLLNEKIAPSALCSLLSALTGRHGRRVLFQSSSDGRARRSRSDPARSRTGGAQRSLVDESADVFLGVARVIPTEPAAR